MNDKVLVAMAGVLCGAGGFVAGILVRQPEISRLQKQVRALQAEVDELAQVATEQNEEIEKMLVNYRAMKVYQFSQKKQLKCDIQDELICQYAAADYLNLLMDTIETGAEMSRDNITFYKEYGKMLEDNQIDDKELETLRPIMLQRHRREIEDLSECNLEPIFERIRQFNVDKKKPTGAGMFMRKHA